MNFLVFIDYLAAILFHVSESYTITAPGNCAHSMPAEQLKNPVEVRMPKYPECWETCGNCGSGEVVIQTLLVRPGDEIGRDDTILVLETGKVALDIPSPQAGRVVGVFVDEGDRVAEGQLLLTIQPA